MGVSPLGSGGSDRAGPPELGLSWAQVYQSPLTCCPGESLTLSWGLPSPGKKYNSGSRALLLMASGRGLDSREENLRPGGWPANGGFRIEFPGAETGSRGGGQELAQG